MVQSLNKSQIASLNWAIEELDSELNQALRNLEDYAESDGNSGSLEDCVQHLKQVNGIFAVTNMSLPKLLCDELQLSIHDYASQIDMAATETLTAVAEAILELSNYLRRVDNPNRLIPQVNNLRALKERELFTESAAFEIDMDEGLKAFKKNTNQPLDSQTIRKLRMLYQRSVLVLIKDGLSNETLAGLQKVFKILYQLGGTPYLSAIGYSGLYLLERLQNKQISLNTALKSQFKRLDEVLRKLIAGSDYQDTGLLKNILFYIALGKDHTDQARRLVNLFSLTNYSQSVSDEDNEVSTYLEPEVLTKVVEVLQSEIEQAKTWLDDCLHGACEFKEALTQVESIIKRVDDTLVMVNASQPRSVAQALQVILSDWKNLDSEKDIPSEELDEFANVMVKLEHRLRRLSQPIGDGDDDSADFLSAKTTILTESRTALTLVKNSITQFIEANWQWDLLNEVPVQLMMVEGALRFYPLEELAKVTNCIRRYVRDSLLEKREEPDQVEVDLFADVIVAIDYYIECLERGTAFNLDFLISRAMENCVQLGFSYEELPTDIDLDETISNDQPTSFATVENDEQKDDTFNDTTQFTIPTEQPEQPVTAAQELDSAPEENIENQDEQQFEEEILPEIVEENNTPVDEEVTPTESTAVEQETVTIEIDDEDMEIIEIFVEEANEILPIAQQQLSDWKAKDQAALLDLRRGFHTLKGGGRMIGATVIGELSWSIENMLNRVIDNSVETTDEIYDLIGQTLDQYPALLKELMATKGGTENDTIISIRERTAVISDPLAAPTSTSNDNDEADVEQTDTETAPQVQNSELTKTFISEAEALRERVVSISGDVNSNDLSQEAAPELLVKTLHTLSDSARMAEFEDLADSFAPFQKLLQHYTFINTRLSSEFISLLSIWSGKFQETLDSLKHHNSYDISPIQRLADGAYELLGREEQAFSNDPSAHRKQRFMPLHRLMAEGLEKLIIAEQLLSDWHMGQLSPDDLDQLQEDLETLRKTAETCGVAEIVQLCLLTTQTQSEFVGEESISEQVEAWLQTAYGLLLGMLDAVASWQVIPQVPQQLIDQVPSLHNQPSDTQAESIEDTSLSTGFDEILSLDESQDLEADTPEIDQLVDEPIEEITDEELTEEPALVDELANEETDSNQIIEDTLLETDELLSDLDLPDLEEETAEETESDFDIAISSFTEVTAPAIESSTTEEPTKEPSPYESPSSEQGVFDSGFLDSDDEFQQELLDTFIEEAEDLIHEIDSSISDWKREPTAFHNADMIHRALHTLKGGARLSGLSKLGDQSHDFESFIIDQQVLQVADETFFARSLEWLDRINAHIEAIQEARLTGQSVNEIDIPEISDSATSVTKIEETDEDSKSVSENALSSSPDDQDAEESAPIGVISSEELLPSETPEETKDKSLSETLLAEAANVLETISEESLQPEIAPSIPSPSPQEEQQTTPPTDLRRERQEQIRLRADTVEEMVNLSGEATVYRGRVEAQLNNLDNSLDELETTIDRIQQLARRLDTETEAQIQFRSEQLAEAGDESDFDPLEMDRYSTLQQLSHQLIESASDLQDLRGTLTENTRDANTLLTQSGRIQTELNGHLMRTRMVPFERILPRLERIVRQVSREVGKSAEIRALDISGELDRQVLERLVPPLEHILRNAIDHGIEDDAGRKAASKPKSGRITINLRRDGSYMVLTVTDDGAGINYSAIRDRAIKRGLVAANEADHLSHEELIEFLFDAGFSTAETLTQISGRGVGMDVVRSTLREMGGNVTLRSERGRGSEFSLSIPFTLSVNRALMIHIGEDTYALPLASLEALVRLSKSDLESYYNNPDKKLSYGADQYDFGYLGEMLKTLERPVIDTIVEPTVSVVLFRVGNYRTALLIDEIIGSYEVVVKSLSPPFNAIPGLSGAAIMGDGSVVVTLDMPKLISSHYASANERNAPAQIAEAVEELRIPTIMVVDDSVTVRKVTTRFLQREGFIVEAARDGVDALRMVHDQQPDLMLVDVEMPRMDGFELLSVLRSTEKFKNLPVVLITSRTGEKHRQRGLSLGAQNYFGKPYREDLLLEEINKLLAGAND